MTPDTTSIIGIGVALVAALVFTPLVRILARKTGMVTRPRGDRWSKKPTALLGGIAIFAAFGTAVLFFLPSVEFGGYVLGASGLMFALGLIDDIRPLKPYQKLVGQIAAASVVIIGGLTLPWTPWVIANMAITLIWLVGITNAVNLLDNMDGLATGVSAIAASVLAATFFLNGDMSEGLLMAAFAATLAGFLIFNFNPASIFMGDCGSMFIGFFLASAALLNVSGGRVSGLLPVLAVPALLLLTPIFDTTLVTLLRMFSPCIVLIDEWVAFVRQSYGTPGLAAGSFDANMTFAQSLTEAFKAAPGAFLVASLPASDIEIGHRDVRTFIGKEQGGGAAHAACGTGDERDTAGDAAIEFCVAWHHQIPWKGQGAAL